MTTQEKITRNIGLIVVILLIVVIIFFILAGEPILTYNPLYLRLVLNAVFILATNIVVAVISLMSFLRRGSISFVFLGGALIVSGLAALFAGWASTSETDATFVIFNVGFLLSSIMQAFGAVHLSAASPTSKVYSHRKTIVVLVLLLSTGSMILLTALALLGLTPSFVTPNGATDLRQFVVGLSFLFFAFASGVIGYQYLRTKARGLYWYSLALALFAVDTFISFNSAQLGDALQWGGRIADYAGGIFFILALLSLRQQSFAGANFSERWFETFSSNRAQLAALFSNMLSGFGYLRVVLDKEGNAADEVFLEVNDTFEKNVGLQRKDIVGKRLSEVIVGVESDPAGWINIFGHTALEGEPVKVEGYLQGLKKWFRVSAYSPEKGYVIVLFEDITEQKKLQIRLEQYAENLEKLIDERTKQLRVSERMAAIGQTAGMVGHDIRNPLQAITGDIYLIEQEVKSNPKCVTPGITESLAAVNENIAYINKIVSDLQDYTREIKPSISSVNLKDIIRSVFSGRRIPENIAVQTSEETDLNIKADPTLLRRIIENLLTNAIQAMPNGGKLTINSFRDGNKAFICIQDTGEGIPEEAEPNVFKPLFTTKAKGQGLGLAVVKRLVDTLNGKISFESQEGKGTKFTIELPT